MLSLRDLWRRGPIHQYFAGLDRCDQATFLVISALAFAIGVAATAIMLAREPGVTSSPLLTAPPLELGFA